MKKLKKFFCAVALLSLTSTLQVFGDYQEREWYENRYIYTYATIPIKEIDGQWYFNSFYIDTLNFHWPNQSNWFPLQSFSDLTGYNYIRRIDHVFAYNIYSQNIKTIGDVDENINSVLPKYFQDMDLRDNYNLHPLDAEYMVMRAINYHRFNRQLHSYQRMQSLSLAAIYHSVAQRDRDQHSQNGFNGETHQDRMELWTLSPNRDYVRSSHVSRHEVVGEFTQEEANRIIDILMTRSTADWIMNGYYHYLGVGIGIQENGTVRLTIHMSTARSEHARDYHVRYVRNNREEAYARHDAMAREWFIANRYGETNPYR